MSGSVCRRALFAAILCAALLPDAAVANHGFDISGRYLMVGFDTGLTVDDDLLGALLGLEVSLVELDREGGWAGLVLALAWASCPDEYRITAGAELGYGLAGIEGGISYDTRGDIGGRLRALGTVGVGSIYAGLAFDRGLAGEFGLLLKMPLEL